MPQNISLGYLEPTQALSPKGRWKYRGTVYNSFSHEAPLYSWSVVYGLWDGKEHLAIRWNGDVETPLGSPKSHARGTWFIVPKELNDGILGSLQQFDGVDIHNAREFLGKPQS